MTTTTQLATGRPAFIADLAAMYYEPKVRVETPTEGFDEIYGRRWRRCWVWFPENVWINTCPDCFADCAQCTLCDCCCLCEACYEIRLQEEWS